jgi:AraC family transcriptional regulator
MPLLSTDPAITELEPIRLIGVSQEMSYLKNETVALWQSFMPLLPSISERIGEDFFSIQEYPAGYFVSFQPELNFKKSARVHVQSSAAIPDGMDELIVEGLYAVFTFRGTPADFGSAMQFILTQWLPQSPYFLDERPHFERLGNKYKRNDPASEEEIWIPVRLR